MQTFYLIYLNTDDDGDRVNRTLFAPFPGDVERVLSEQMNGGDTALIYQIDAHPPRTPEEAVAWLNQEPRCSLQVLVAEARRVSDYEAPSITPVEVKGFVFTPVPEVQA